MNELLDMILTAPSTQIDSTIIPRLRDLKTTPVLDRPNKMKSILDDCAYAALASDFAMRTMDLLWNYYLEEVNKI